MGKLKKRFLLLAGVFGAAIVGASCNFESDKAYALTNTQVPNTQFATGLTSSSFDGRYIAFISSINTLVPNDTNNVEDAFLYDTQLNATTRISVASNGTQADKKTTRVILSGNGRYALFASPATTLDATAIYSSTSNNLFLRDLKLDTTTLIAIAYDGSSVSHTAEGLSEDGRFIYFVSSQSGQLNRLMVKDMKLGTTTQVDVNESGTGGNNGIGGNSSSVSCDGRFVAFESQATNLVSNDSNQKSDIFLVDRMNGHTIKNITINGTDHSVRPNISCDGNYVFFHTRAADFAPNDNNGYYDIIRYSVANETFEIATLDSAGNQYGDEYSTNGYISGTYDISMDGTNIVFSASKRMTYGSSSQLSSRISVRDMSSSSTSDISYGFAYGRSASSPSMDADGDSLFYTYADNTTNRAIYRATDY
jgi:hypothetical protein